MLKEAFNRGLTYCAEPDPVCAIKLKETVPDSPASTDAKSPFVSLFHTMILSAERYAPRNAYGRFVKAASGKVCGYSDIGYARWKIVRPPDINGDALFSVCNDLGSVGTVYASRHGKKRALYKNFAGRKTVYRADIPLAFSSRRPVAKLNTFCSLSCASMNPLITMGTIVPGSIVPKSHSAVP